MFKRKPRFDLFAVFEWTAGIAFVCALMAGAGGNASWTTDFKSLPPDESTLVTWLKEQDRTDVAVTREGNSVTLAAIAGVFHSFNNLPKPPWQELGYSRPLGMRGSTNWTMFSGSAYLWFTGFGILIVLGLIRRRYIDRS